MTFLSSLINFNFLYVFSLLSSSCHYCFFFFRVFGVIGVYWFHLHNSVFFSYPDNLCFHIFLKIYITELTVLIYDLKMCFRFFWWWIFSSNFLWCPSIIIIILDIPEDIFSFFFNVFFVYIIKLIYVYLIFV